MQSAKTFFKKEVWCSVLASRGLNVNRQCKLYVVFDVSRRGGNTKHSTLRKKKVLLIAKPCWFVIVIRFTIFGMNFYPTKILQGTILKMVSIV
jgi:hypothetical protein